MNTLSTILVVEDTEDDVFFLKRALNGAGVNNPLQVAVDGQQALDYLSGAGVFADRGKYPFPFLILLDLKLPYVMGLDVLKCIRQQPAFNAIKIVVLSSSQQESDIKATYALGGTSYLVKPPTAAKFIELIKTLSVDRFESPERRLPR